MKQYKIRYFPVMILFVTVFLVFPLLIVMYQHVFANTGSVVITSPQNDQYLNNPAPDIRGLAEPSVNVSVYMDNVWYGNTTSDSNGDWTMNTVYAIPDGTYSAYAVADTQNGPDQSATVTFTIDTVPPTVTIDQSVNGYINKPLFTGTTEPGLSVTVEVYGDKKVVTADSSGNWSCLFDGLPEGTYDVDASAVDRAGNIGTAAPQTFILDMTRPQILPGLFPAEDMTRVDVSVYPRVYMVENSILDSALLQNALILKDSSGNAVSGRVNSFVYDTVYKQVTNSYYNSVYNRVYSFDSTVANYYYQMEFVPAAGTALTNGQTYTAIVDPQLTDLAGNYVYSRQWSFTTVSGDLSKSVHGDYVNRVNACSKCHDTHKSDSPELIRPDDNSSMDEYCNACHDGTSAPPVKWPFDGSKHDFQVSIDGTTETSSCTGCHDPHLDWSPDNPNMLQDYYYYKHTNVNNDPPHDSSEQQICENCHMPNVKNDSRTTKNVYKYDKTNTTKGTAADYSLCLRCHQAGYTVNGAVYNAPDIAQYYSDTSPSLHKISPAPDGSPINGFFACSDCHETHGSANLYQLKQTLGLRNAQTFTSSGTVWDAANERAFCTSCHNNSTELYGMVAALDGSIDGHQSGDARGCSECHGGAFIAAAHAPTK